MATHWNEEFFSQFTSVVREDESSRHLHERSSQIVLQDVKFDHSNDRPIEMPELDLYMHHTDLVTKADEVVSDGDSERRRHPTEPGVFDGSGLSLATTDALLLQSSHTALEPHHFITSSSRQMPELVPHCLQSLGSALDVTGSEDFQSQRSQQTLYHGSLLQQVSEASHPPQLHCQLDQHQQENHSSHSDLLLPHTIEFPSSNPHALPQQNICSTPPQPPLHLSQPSQTQSSIDTKSQQVSQSQLSCEDVHSLSSFDLHESIIGPSTLNTKLSAMVSEQSARPEDCASSITSPTGTLSFLSSGHGLQLLTAGEELRSDNNDVSLRAPATVDTMPGAKAKAKKRKLPAKSSDSVWLNSKSFESQQRNRQATEILIEIVCSPKYQEQLNSSTVKKKSVWRDIGEDFNSRGYILENPGQKCFQKWRNLERSFRQYEHSKTTQAAVVKNRPEFYDKLQPFLKDKLSLDGMTDGKWEKVEERLMEKYLDLDSISQGKDDVPHTSNQPYTIDCDNPSKDTSDPTSAERKLESVSSDKGPVSKKCKSQTEPLCQNFVSTSDHHNELVASLVESMKAQQRHLVDVNAALNSIKDLLEDQKREREVSKEESKLRFLELKALIEKNQKEKMAFVYEFVKSIQQNCVSHNGQK